MDLKIPKLPPQSWVAFILGSISSLTIGMICIFLFDKNLFFTLEIIKLILLCISISGLPSVFSFLFCLLIIENQKNDHETHLLGLSIFSNIINVLGIIIPILFKIYFDINFKSFLGIFLLCYILLLITIKVGFTKKPDLK
jgi:hypothetical protein